MKMFLKVPILIISIFIFTLTVSTALASTPVTTRTTKTINSYDIENAKDEFGAFSEISSDIEEELLSSSDVMDNVIVGDEAKSIADSQKDTEQTVQVNEEDSEFATINLSKEEVDNIVDSQSGDFEAENKVTTVKKHNKKNKLKIRTPRSRKYDVIITNY